MILKQIMMAVAIGLIPLGLQAQDRAETEVYCSGTQDLLSREIRVFKSKSGVTNHEAELSRCDLEFSNNDRYECKSEPQKSYTYMTRMITQRNHLVYKDGVSALVIDPSHKDQYGNYRGVFIERGPTRVRLLCNVWGQQ